MSNAVTRHAPSAEPADPLAPVRDAVERGDWVGALDLLREAGSAAGAAEAIELRAQALYATGAFEASVAAWEERYALAVAGGEPADAARAAATVAMFLMIDSGLMAPVRGWLRRAERQLGGQGEVPAHALIALVRTYERFMCGDMEAAGHQAALAIALGERLAVPPAVVIGRVAGARIRIFEGDVDGGLDQLDDVAVLLMSGEVDHLTTGMMYCELICAAQGLGLHDRASEWTAMMQRWQPGRAIGGIAGRCRVHRAEILRMSGPCDRAEEEALAACEELRPWMRREFGWPLVELGNIRLRKGDLAGAEEAYLVAHEHVWTPHPGLALIHLAQGDVDGASVLIADAIAHPFDIPSKERPPFGDLRLAPLLEAQAEIAAAAGDVDTARRAAEALRGIATVYRSGGLDAAAALAGARAALVAGELEAAIVGSTTAVTAWAELGAPFETAVARTVLAEAYERAGNVEGARIERRSAHAAFVAYGAAGWAERTGRLLSSGTPDAGRTATTQSLTATFKRTGGTRALRFGELSVVMSDLKGFRYLERLLADPAREFHVLDLVTVERGSDPTGPARRDEWSAEDVVEGTGAGLPLLDDEARASYRRRLAEVEEDIEEATRMNDPARADLARRDREYLVRELARAVGLHGHVRASGGSAERARMSVARSIRYALSRLAEHHPPLAGHLTRCVRTGTYCSYTPDPLAVVYWEL